MDAIAYRVAGFRLAALLVLLVPLPLLALWLLEGGLLLDLQGFDSDTRETALVAAHRIAGWWVPFVSGAVFGYGITRTEPDARLAAMGNLDPRRLWGLRWLPIAAIFVAFAAMVAAALAAWSGESLPRLVGGSVSATFFSLATAYTVGVLTGASPAMVAFATVAISATGALLPPLLGLGASFSLVPGPLGWLRGEAYRTEFLWHDLIVIGVSAAIAAFGLLVPPDVRDVRWIARSGGDGA